MKRTGKQIVICLLFFAFSYLLLCMVLGGWLQGILIKCNELNASYDSVSEVVCSEKTMEELRYRSWFTLEASLTDPSFEIKTTFPVVSFQSGKVRAKLFVSWFGYENTQEKKVLKQGGDRIPVEIELCWEQGRWVILDVENHWFIH